MFGNSGKQMERLVGRHHWDAINKKLPDANTQAKISLAAACGHSTDEAAPMVLIGLLGDRDENVLLQTVKSLGDVGHADAKTHLLWLADHMPSENAELRQAIHDALAKLEPKK